MTESPGKLLAVAAIVILGVAGGWQAWQERGKGRAPWDGIANDSIGNRQLGASDAAGGVHASASLAQPNPSMMGGSMYVDPAGKFSIQVPPGWQADAQLKGVVLTDGGATVTASPFSGATSVQHILSLLLEQYAEKWQGMQTLEQGEFLLAGSPANYVLISATNPRGVPSLVRLTATMRGNLGFVLILSAPTEVFTRSRTTLQAIEGSLTLAAQ
jgi:hypothetical protein